MKAAVVHQPGPPSVLTIEERPIPEVRPGWVLVKVHGFGLNRSELYTRQGDSPSVSFPRVLGIECVGEIADPSDSDLRPGQKIAAMMGEMGRAFDGGYAQYALLPRAIVVPVETELDWARFAALPETYQTAHGSLTRVMRAKAGDRLLIRGGTSALGLAMLSLAKTGGMQVVATTRDPGKVAALESAGADDAWLDDGDLQSRGETVDLVYELVGVSTLKDSLACLSPGGLVCVAGMLDGDWRMADFAPLFDIPSESYLGAYRSRVMPREDLQNVVDAVADGRLSANLHATFTLDQIVDAHELMEANRAFGKVVVTVDH